MCTARVVWGERVPVAAMLLMQVELTSDEAIRRDLKGPVRRDRDPDPVSPSELYLFVANH